MNRKRKSLLLWQMIVLVVLPLTVCLSSFFPRVALTTEVVDEISKEMPILSSILKQDLTFSGWEIMFSSEDAVKEKLQRSFRVDNQALQDLYSGIGDVANEYLGKYLDSGYLNKIDSNSAVWDVAAGVIVKSLGYMRVGYVIMYVACLILPILSVLWYGCKWDRIGLVIINMAVSLGGMVVNVLGIVNLGRQMLSAACDAVSANWDKLSGEILGILPGNSLLDGLLGNWVEKMLGYAEKNLDEPMRLFGIRISLTFGGLGCTVVCCLLFLITVGMMIGSFVSRGRAAVHTEPGWEPVVDPGPMLPPGGMPATAMPPLPDSMPGGMSVGKITVTRGEFRGALIEVREGEEVILGRDPSMCHLVFKNGKISRKHCGIRYNPQTNTYFVRNYSSNGTMLSAGQSVPGNLFVEVLPGNMVWLSEGCEEILLG